jgi:BRCT domain type II-containing protein
VRVFIVALTLSAVPSTPPLEARPHGDKTLCKKIKAAVWAGRTLDQIMAELDVDAKQVMKCTQQKGKPRKQKAAKPAKSKRSGSTTAPKPNTAKTGQAAPSAARP